MILRLQELSELRDGWLDGEGKAPTQAALDTADELLRRPMGIYPTEDGGIQIEMNHRLEIVVKPNGDIETWVY